MRILFFAFLITFILGCSKEEKETTTKGRLFLVIPTTIAPVMKDEVNQFLGLYKEGGAQITYTIASTEEAINYFISDSGRIAFIPKQLNSSVKDSLQKKSQYFNELVVAYDGIAVIVSSSNNMKQMTTTDIQKILSGSITKWEQLQSARPKRGAIKIFCRENSEDYEFLKQRLSIGPKSTAKIINTASDLNTIESVENDPMSIGFTSLSWIDSAKSQAKVLELGRTKDDKDTTFAPPAEAIGKFYSTHPAYIYLNYYPLKRAIYMYTRTHVDLAAGFGTFVATAEGQKIILKHGLLPGTQKIKLRSGQP